MIISKVNNAKKELYDGGNVLTLRARTENTLRMHKLKQDVCNRIEKWSSVIFQLSLLSTLGNWAPQMGSENLRSTECQGARAYECACACSHDSACVSNQEDMEPPPRRRRCLLISEASRGPDGRADVPSILVLEQFCQLNHHHLPLGLVVSSLESVTTQEREGRSDTAPCPAPKGPPA
jgi:hypothetical protein